MKTFLTIVITAIVVVAFFVLTGRYKPMWLIKLEFDKNGFPYLKKEGDLFILKNIVYWYHNGIWVQLDANGFPIAPAPKIDDTFVKNGTSYTFTDKGWVLTPVGPPDDNSSSRTKGQLNDTILIKLKNLGVPENKITEVSIILNRYDDIQKGKILNQLNIWSLNTMRSSCWYESFTKKCPGCSTFDKTFGLNGCEFGL